MEDRDIARELFGSVKKIKATGNHKPDFEELRQPLEWEKGIMRLFCQGCGITLEISRNFAEELAEEVNTKVPDNPLKYYFQSSRCNYCDGTDNTIKLIEIAMQTGNDL